ncbi:hypothetical protein F4X10_12465 [Candidatus Poribacteria bacterium]|nr:hypothetical protein [Candidatus Poribacteria bacterium]
MTINTLVKTVENLSRQIHVEIMDDVVRVGGITYPVRGKLKLLGFQWDQRRREWYYLMPEADLDGNESDPFTN